MAISKLSPHEKSRQQREIDEELGRVRNIQDLAAGLAPGTRKNLLRDAANSCQDFLISAESNLERGYDEIQVIEFIRKRIDEVYNNFFRT